MIKNYIPLLSMKAEEVISTSGLTMGEFLYSIHRYVKKMGYDITNPSSVLTVTDEDFYKCLCKIQEDVREEPLN